MLVSIKHKTTYIYEEVADYTIQSLRLIPKSFSGQNVKSWSVSSPNQENALNFIDCFGNDVRTITINEPHDRVEICAEGIVETTDCNGIVSGFFEMAPVSVFLRPTKQTKSNEAIEKLARGSVKGDTLSTLHELNHLILQQVEYEKGSTNSRTTAAEALSREKGVCQDHTHIFISATRTLNIPARYITGYLITDDQDEAHHAWAEVFVADLGWVGFDISNQLCPTENYVRLACGLDAEDAAPIRGTVQGGDKEKLDVYVDVQQQ